MSRGTAEITLEEYDELMELKESSVSRSEYNRLKEECKELENGYAYHYYSDCYNRNFTTREEIKDIIDYDFRCKMTSQKEKIERMFSDSFRDKEKKELIRKKLIAQCSLLELLRLRKKCRKEVIK